MEGSKLIVPAKKAITRRNVLKATAAVATGLAAGPGFVRLCAGSLLRADPHRLSGAPHRNRCCLWPLV